MSVETRGGRESGKGEGGGGTERGGRVEAIDFVFFPIHKVNKAFNI